jgi:predicted 3-demethylubiquinone-9 3-methyltransferase (glyoxalase superfamily)
MQKQKITTFLWYDHQAEEAAEFYVRTFNARRGADQSACKILNVARYGEAGRGKPGTAMTVDFQLDGQYFTALNGGPGHEFTDAISLFVHCASQDEVDDLWNALTAEGREDGPGWLKDPYGVSWQIIPDRLMELLGDPDPGRSQRAMQAMLQMQKIVIADLERAADAA